MEEGISRARLVLGAAALFALVAVPVALAGPASDSQGPEASASASLEKKFKKLRKRINQLERDNATLEQQVAGLEGEQGGPRPPSGQAGGDLTGDYPNPSIDGGSVNSEKVENDSLTGGDVTNDALTDADLAASAQFNGAAAGGDLTGTYPSPDLGAGSVGAAEIQNPTRSVNLPLGSFLNLTDKAAIDFTASNGTAPDFVFFPSAGADVIEWDDDSDGAGGDTADTDYVESTFVVPPDYASGGSLALRVSKDGDSGPGERLFCQISRNEFLAAQGAATTTTAANTLYMVDPGLSYAAGESVVAACGVDDGVALGDGFNDRVYLHAIEFRYTATQ